MHPQRSITLLISKSTQLMLIQEESWFQEEFIQISLQGLICLVLRVHLAVIPCTKLKQIKLTPIRIIN